MSTGSPGELIELIDAHRDEVAPARGNVTDRRRRTTQPAAGIFHGGLCAAAIETSRHFGAHEAISISG